MEGRMVEDQVDTVEFGSEEQNFLSKVHARPDGQAGGDLAESLPDSAALELEDFLCATSRQGLRDASGQDLPEELPPKGSKRKAEGLPKQPKAKARARLRHSEAGAVPPSDDPSGLDRIPFTHGLTALGNGPEDDGVIGLSGLAKAGRRKPGKLTLAEYPSIAKWWHPSKNCGKQPGDHKHAGKERVWLQCDGCQTCGEVHQWDARVDNLTQYGDKAQCPFCKSKGPSFCSCRSVSKNLRLAAEWHEDNPSPTKVALGNDKRHKWRCSDAACRHVWEASPTSRSRCGANCPECARKRKGKVKHASLAANCPNLATEWNEEKNGRPATDITCGSKKKCWWVCKECRGAFEARVQARALLGSGCPRCWEDTRGQAREKRPEQLGHNCDVVC